MTRRTVAAALDQSLFATGLLALTLLAGSSLLAGCDPAPEARAAPVAQPANPLSGVERVEDRLAGTVTAVLDAGSYTYFTVDVDGRSVWAVVMGAGPAVGQAIDARVFGRKTDFRSRRLDRTFAELAFVSLSP